MARNVPVARQAQLLAVIAVAGAAPLTVGAILWVTGTVLQAGYHGHWSATADTGEVLIVAGLLCGLCMFVLAANSVRWTPRVPVGRARRVLQPLASPEHQAWLADPPQPSQPQPSQPQPGPPPAQLSQPQPSQLPGLQPGFLPPGPVPPGQAPPEVAYPPGGFPPGQPWPASGAAPDWPAYPDPRETDSAYLRRSGQQDPGGGTNPG